VIAQSRAQDSLTWLKSINCRDLGAVAGKGWFWAKTGQEKNAVSNTQTNNAVFKNRRPVLNMFITPVLFSVGRSVIISCLAPDLASWLIIDIHVG
jgi:hypothetical protein